MGKNRLRALVLALGLLGTGLAFGQTGPDLTPLYDEFAVIFDELGKDTLPYLQQFGLIMDGTGRAEVGKSLFISLSAGAVFTPGIATFRAGDNPLSYFDLDAMVGGELAEGSLEKSLYDGSKTFFLDPGLRLSIGLALANGIEFWGHFGIIPQPVADLVGGLAGIDGLELNRLNAGGRLRFVLVRDQPGLPAISLGVGYTYTQFNLGLDLAAVPLGDIDFSGFSVALGGTLFANTRLHTAGVELALSKKLLIFAPFLRLGAWYQWASYTAGIENLGLTLTPPTPPGGTPVAVTGTLNPSEQSINDLSFVIPGGLELVLGKVSLILQGSYDTASAAPAASTSFQFRI